MKYFAKIVVFSLLAVGFLLQATPASAQNFTAAATLSEESGELNGFIPVYIQITNVSGRDLNLRVEITNKSSLPEDWMTQICFFQNCFQPNQDIIDGEMGADESEALDITFMTGSTSGKYCVEVSLINLDNTSEKIEMTFCATAGATSTGSAPAVRSMSLSQNYPNPFVSSKHSATSISYFMPTTGEATLRVYNLLGKEVRTLVSGVRPAGKTVVSWDGRDDNNRPVPAGVYVYKLSTKAQTMTRRLLITR